MKVLVTGNSGLIGSTIVDKLNNDAILFRTKKTPRDLMNKNDILQHSFLSSLVNKLYCIIFYIKNLNQFLFDLMGNSNSSNYFVYK